MEDKNKQHQQHQQPGQPGQENTPGPDRTRENRSETTEQE